MVHPHCGLCQTVLPFQGWTVLHCVYEPCFIYPSVGGQLGGFHLGCCECYCCEHGCTAHWFLFWWDIRDPGVDSFLTGCAKGPLFVQLWIFVEIQKEQPPHCQEWFSHVCGPGFITKLRSDEAALNVDEIRSEESERCSERVIWHITVKLW